MFDVSGRHGVFDVSAQLRSHSLFLLLLFLSRKEAKESLGSSLISTLDGWSHRPAFLGKTLISLSASLQLAI